MSLGLLTGALRVALTAAAPFLACLFLVGLALGVLQAGTGVQDSNASQSAKLGAVGLVAVLVAPWVLRLLTGFTRELWLNPGRFLQ